MRKGGPHKPSPGVCGIITFAINFIVLLSGSIIAGGGCFIMYYLTRLEIDSHYIIMTAYIIAIGSSLILLSIMAFVGVCSRKSWCITFYIPLLFVFLAAEISAGVLFLVYSDDVVVKLKVILKELVKKISEKGEHYDILAKLQSLMGCCGAEGPNDYNTPQLFCCPKDSSCITYSKTGCNKALSDFLEKYQTSIGVSLIVLGAAEFLAVITSYYTRKNLNNRFRA